MRVLHGKCPLMTWKVISFLIDATIHTALLFGWSSITEIMKANEFFRQTGTEATDGLRFNQSDVSIKQVISRAENESCFVDNEEQGSQSQGLQNFTWRDHLTTVLTGHY